MKTSDPHAIAMMRTTAQRFQHLAGLRGVSSSIEVTPNGEYFANGENCGNSVHGLYEWLNRQPNVKP